VALATGLRPADAQDAAQEALVRAWRARARCASPDPWPWMSRIARNEALRIVARRRPELPLDAADHAATDPALERTEERVDVARAMAVLAPADRLLLGLRYADDRTQLSIAQELGVPEGTVKVRLHRVRSRLRRALEDT
jgi:RNA polymerase sigma-70 factor (ECF subfamily)